MAKPLVALMQPSAGYAVPHKGAAKAFYRPSLRCVDRIELEQGSSMLPRVFNMLWADALNARAGHAITHGAMIHDDVVPDPGWLDTLLDELERTGADVISAVVPIKDSKGLTSTAVDVGDPWWVRRLTLYEVFNLPETFEAKDVPWNTSHRPLLLNTGLWACRFDSPWVEKIAFKFMNRIVQMPDGEWMGQDIPEDWDVSRQFEALGLKVCATRKVGLLHALPQWHNRSPWGDWPTDLAYLGYQRKLRGDITPEGWKFPADVPGWLSETEGAALAQLAAGKQVLEIGSYCGRSTVCLAQTAAYVHAVDTFDGRATTSPRNTLADFIDNLVRYGVLDRVTAYRGPSDATVPDIDVRFGLAFIDGDHSYEAVLRDARLASSKLASGGLLAFHDYGRPGDEGVTAAVNQLISAGAALLDVADTVASLRLAA